MAEPTFERAASALLLPDEQINSVSSATIEARNSIYAQLRELPPEVFDRLQYFQPQVGCFNRCTFCSQHAGTEVWQLSRTGLRDLFAAIHRVVSERSPSHPTLGGDRAHKPRVLFPYLDNDIASYAYLDEYVRLVRDLFNGRVRLTTVGFSANNSDLVQMHSRIANEMTSAIAGVRLSVTPFTIGWSAGTGERHRRTSRSQFWRDFSNTLTQYLPLLDMFGESRESLSVELRFRPLVQRVAVVDDFFSGRHVIAAGPHLLLSTKDRMPQASRVLGIRNNRFGMRHQSIAPEPVLSHEGTPYLHVTSDTMAAYGTAAYVDRVLAGDITKGLSRQVMLHRMEHSDGEYYVTDPTFAGDGSLRSLVVYPQTPSRAGGYNDATRFFLNTLLEHKKRRGLGRRDKFEHATARDIASVVLGLRRCVTTLSSHDSHAARYVRDELTPLVSGYASSIVMAGLPPSLFFSRDFTIDTGQAVNQGRAFVFFKDLVSKPDIPTNPWEERNNLISHSKGKVWRLAPVPYPLSPGSPPGLSRRGRKNSLASDPSMLFEEIDPRHTKPSDFDTGEPLRRIRITGIDMEHIRLDQAHADYLYPGLNLNPAQ